METNKQNEIDDIFGSLDGIKRATTPDFFYTRLQVKMQNRLEGSGDPSIQRPWTLRPVFALTVLVGVLLVNAAVILQKKDVPETVVNETEILQSIAAEYSLNDNNTVLFDLNQDK